MLRQPGAALKASVETKTQGRRPLCSEPDLGAKSTK